VHVPRGKKNVQLAKFRIKKTRTREREGVGVEEGDNEVILVMTWITMAE
jgi:hypothetical protein